MTSQNLPASQYGDMITSVERLTQKQKEKLYKAIFGKSCHFLEAVQDSNICFDEIEKALLKLYPKEDALDTLYYLKRDNYGPYSCDPGSAEVALFTRYRELTPLGLGVLRKVDTKVRNALINNLQWCEKERGSSRGIDFTALDDEILLWQFTLQGYSVAQVSKIICEAAQ